MKEWIFTVALALLSGGYVQAQQVNAGFEGGIGFSSMAIQRNGEGKKPAMLTGLRLGGIANIGLTGIVSVQPGLFYATRGYKAQEITAGQVQQITFITRNIELPVNFQFKFDLGKGYFFTGGGPYAAYAIGGQMKTEQTGEKMEAANAERAITTGNGPADDLKPLDLGLNLNLGYLSANGFFLRANAGFGLSNLRPQGNSENSMRNFSTAFTLGYMMAH